MKISFFNYSSFNNNILHDAVFSINGIKLCKETKQFELTCFRLLEQTYENRKILPFVFEKKHKRSRCILVFNNVDGMEQNVKTYIDWYSIVDITFERPKITIKTEGCMDLIIYSEHFGGYIQDTGEIIFDSFGYTDIVFGRE